MGAGKTRRLPLPSAIAIIPPLIGRPSPLIYTLSLSAPAPIGQTRPCLQEASEKRTMTCHGTATEKAFGSNETFVGTCPPEKAQLLIGQPEGCRQKSKSIPSIRLPHHP